MCYKNNIKYCSVPALQIPWSRISKRLHRRDTFVGIEDYAINNFRLISGSEIILENIELIIPLFGTNSERIFTLLLVGESMSFVLVGRLPQ